MSLLNNNKLQKVQLGMLADDVQNKFNGYDVSLAQKAAQTDLNTTNTNVTANTSQMNSQEINVKYPPAPLVGAKGDGSDETTVINNIINAMSANMVLFFPKGTYGITTLTLKSHLTIRGAGLAETTLKYVGASGGTAIPSPSNRQYYLNLERFSLDCNNLADVGLDLSNVAFSNATTLLILSPRSKGVILDSSKGGTYWATPTTYNNLTNVQVYVSASVVAFQHGFYLSGGSNSHRFINCRVSSDVKIGTAFYINDMRDNNNLFMGCASEGMDRACYINGEFNTFLSLRSEQTNKVFEFGTDSTARNNMIINPTLYTYTTIFTNLDPTKNNVILMPNGTGFNMYNNLNLKPSSGNTTIETIPNNGGGYALRNMGASALKFQEYADDSYYRIKVLASDSTFYNAIEVPNAIKPTPVVQYGLRFPSYTTASRPTSINGEALGNYSTHKGFTIFDETLGKLITWGGTAWKDGTGTTV